MILTRGWLAGAAVLVAESGTRGDVIAASNMAAGWTTTSFFVGVGYSGSPNFTNETPAQRFTVAASGALTTLTTRMNRSAGGEPLTVSIRTSSGTSPGTVLGSVIVPESAFPTLEDVVTFDFTAVGIALASGTSYYAVFSTPTAIPSNVRYAMDLIAPNQPFGSAYQFSRTGAAPWDAPSSLGIEIPLEVRVVPGTGSAAVFGLLAARRRRR